jgi:hypothetical protein
MRIDPGFQGNPLHGRRIGRPAQGSNAASRARSDEPAESDPKVTSEAAALIASLHDIPEVRPEVIEEVRQRLSRGEFMSRDAAEKTAEAILADLASFIGQ